MWRAAILLLFSCPGHPEPKPAANPDCVTYPRLLDEAQRTPEADRAVEIQGMNACGCTYPLKTTAALAAEVDAAFRSWQGVCGPVNCDTPCAGWVLPTQ